jgi:hypothetical protein
VRRPFLQILSQAAVEHFANLFWSGHQVSRLSDPNRFEGRIADRLFQPQIYEIQVKQTQERVE